MFLRITLSSESEDDKNVSSTAPMSPVSQCDFLSISLKIRLTKAHMFSVATRLLDTRQIAMFSLFSRKDVLMWMTVPFSQSASFVSPLLYQICHHCCVPRFQCARISSVLARHSYVDRDTALVWGATNLQGFHYDMH